MVQGNVGLLNRLRFSARKKNVNNKSHQKKTFNDTTHVTTINPRKENKLEKIEKETFHHSGTKQENPNGIRGDPLEKTHARPGTKMMLFKIYFSKKNPMRKDYNQILFTAKRKSFGRSMFSLNAKFKNKKPMITFNLKVRKKKYYLNNFKGRR